MLAHFDKLKTSLKSVHQYPTITSQRARFQSRGWQEVNIWDLWEAWSGDDFLTSAERISLDNIEPFDEWEELMLFGRHYFVMHALATPLESGQVSLNYHAESAILPHIDVKPTSHPASKAIKRRFGNGLLLSTPEGYHYAAHVLGLGNDSRSDTYDIYSLDHATSPQKLPLHGPSPRMCSTLTDLGEYGVLMTGGRASPAKAFSDCWLLQKGNNLSWQKKWDLPVPLFRHSAIRLHGSSLVLVLGGKTGPSLVSSHYFVFHPQNGWLKCEPRGPAPVPTFGSVVCNAPRVGLGPGKFEGLLCGGCQQDGTMSEKSYWWCLDMTESQVIISLYQPPSIMLTASLAIYNLQ